MKLKRVIKVYQKKDENRIETYVIDLDAKGILNTLEDLILKEDDSPDEIYYPYYLTESQIKGLI